MQFCVRKSAYWDHGTPLQAATSLLNLKTHSLVWFMVPIYKKKTKKIDFKYPVFANNISNHQIYRKAVYIFQKHESVVEPINLFVVTMHSVRSHRKLKNNKNESSKLFCSELCKDMISSQLYNIILVEV